MESAGYVTDPHEQHAYLFFQAAIACVDNVIQLCDNENFVSGATPKELLKTKSTLTCLRINLMHHMQAVEMHIRSKTQISIDLPTLPGGNHNAI